jgi:aminoglycoside phosphotransferase (APT) family kinase protein
MALTRLRAAGDVAPTLLRVAALAAVDRARPRPARDAGDVPAAPEAVTPEWMTGALCGGAPGAHVLAVRPGDGSSGTTYRRRLHLEYDEAGRAAGLPATVFTKSTPGLTQRITQAITGAVEARFYVHLRPLLDVEAPVCFHGVVDDRRMTAITVLEDLVATKDATFLTPTTRLTRADAEQVVDTLASVHATLGAIPAPAYLKTYQGHWRDAFAMVNVERYFLRCFGEAGELLAPGVRADPARAWRAVLASIALHDRLPATLVHNDVHLGNWYRTAEGRLGLCDWQAVVRGHWSRDLAYALATTLTVADRRAWEADLVARYADRLAAAGGPTAGTDAWTAYRQQLWGALAYWAPTYSPPRLMPADMQPREISGELLRRISTACEDLDAFAAVGV